MDSEQLRRQYTRAPQAALELGVDVNRIYRLMQTGELACLCIDGKWFAENRSIARLKAQRAAEQRAAVG